MRSTSLATWPSPLRLSKVALLTGSLPPHDVCGVGDYTFRLHQALGAGVELLHVPIRRVYEPSLLSVFSGRDLVHVQYPTEGWGESVLPSLLGMGRGGTRLLVTLHEWSEMNRLRRLSLRPLLSRADGFVFVTPYERDAFLAEFPGRRTWVVPIGVNLVVPSVAPSDALAYRTSKGGSDLLLTHFGFLHAAKQPRELLLSLVELKRLGRRGRLLVVGGFKADDRTERLAFRRGIRELGLEDDVELLGFLDDDQAALALAAADANVSLFADGLSPRRGSFWYAAQHGTHLVTTELRAAGEFSQEFDPSQVRFVPRRDPAGAVARELASLPPYEAFRFRPLAVRGWDEIAAVHRAIYAQVMG